MTTPFTFSYIVVEQRAKDAQGHALVGVYPFLTKNQEETPIRILQSSIPAITANIYSGNPYPEFDYTEAVERRIKRDIQQKTAYTPLVAGQIHATDWHLQAIRPVSVPEQR
jgi:hypothetical protein